MHLSVTRIESLIRDTAKGKRKPQAHPDGGNLYLQVQTSGASWLYRFSHAGKRRVIGVGTVSCDLTRHGSPAGAGAAQPCRRWR